MLYRCHLLQILLLVLSYAPSAFGSIVAPAPGTIALSGSIPATITLVSSLGSGPSDPPPLVGGPADPAVPAGKADVFFPGGTFPPDFYPTTKPPTPAPVAPRATTPAPTPAPVTLGSLIQDFLNAVGEFLASLI